MKVYFDNAASTKILDNFKEKLWEIFNIYANPSSIHSAGKKSKFEIEKAREYIAKSLNVNSKEIIFTSGATEANNLIITSIAKTYPNAHIITSKIEHPSILKVCEALEKENYEISYINVDEDGIISLEELKNSIKENTKLVSIMAVNNETGVKQPIEEISEILKDKNIYFHSDMVQYIFKEKIDLKKLNLDAISLSFHKFHAPKGLGIAYIKDNFPSKKLIYGGLQEKNKRAGTENLNSIILGYEVYKYMEENLEKHRIYLEELSKYFIKSLEQFGDKIKLNNQKNKIPEIINLQIKGMDFQYLLPLFDLNGIYISAGSACQSGTLSPSKVLLAQNISELDAKASIRISLSIENKKEEIDYFIKVLHKILGD